MWPLKKKGISIQPGEGKHLSLDIPKDKEIGDIVLNYDDEYGNKYETRVTVNFKEKKVMRQNYKMIKKVKDIPEKDRPKLVIDGEHLENYLKSKNEI